MSNSIGKVCLVCMDRTGSNMIESRINTHPNIVFYNEIFHRQCVIFNDTRIASGPGILARRDRDPAAFVSSIWGGEFEPNEKREGLHSVGFKLFLNHNAGALRYVVNSDASIIFLRRRNALNRFSSFKIAVATGDWKSVSKSNRKTHKVKFHAPEFRAYIQNYLSLETMFEMTLNRWNRSYLDVWYEDISSQSDAWERLVQYIGCDPKDFSETSLVKQNTSDVLARFSNPDEVVEFVSQINRRDWLTT